MSRHNFFRRQIRHQQGRRQVKKRGVDTHGEHVEREPITGSEGRAPSGVQGQSPWSGGQGGKALLKLKTF